MLEGILELPVTIIPAKIPVVSESITSLTPLSVTSAVLCTILSKFTTTLLLIVAS